MAIPSSSSTFVTGKPGHQLGICIWLFKTSLRTGEKYRYQCISGTSPVSRIRLLTG
jgi:hypothetical protein